MMRRLLPLFTLSSVSLITGFAHSQIKPVYSYNGISRPFPVTIAAPKSGGAQLEVALYQPGSKVAVAKAKVAVGSADLVKLFPQLWKVDKPKLLYAQVLQAGKGVGPALVLQPMTNPTISKLAQDGKTVEFVPDEDQAFAGYRVWVDQDIVFETTLGKLRFRMRPDAAPNTVWNITQLVAGGYYRDVIWHRVVAVARGNPFVIQGGDPTGTGSGGPGFAYALEDSPLPHDFGVISIARSTDPNTNGSQVFVCLSRAGTERLDHKYASFGEAIEGADVILKIAAVKTGKEDRPETPPVIKIARLVPAAPYGTGPTPVKRPE